MKKSVISLALTSLTVLSGIQFPASAADQIRIENGTLVYASSGRWVPFRWHDGSNMKAKSFGATTTRSNTTFIVVVGGDDTMLFRIGPANRNFFNSKAEWFTWRANEKDRRMKARQVLGVSTLDGDSVRIDVVAGDGRRCTLDANVYDVYRSNAEWWDCI